MALNKNRPCKLVKTIYTETLRVPWSTSMKFRHLMIPLYWSPSMPSAVQVHAAAVSAGSAGRTRVPSAPETPVLPTAPAALCPGPPASGGAATAPSGAAPPTTPMTLYHPFEQKQPLWGDGDVQIVPKWFLLSVCYIPSKWGHTGIFLCSSRPKRQLFFCCLACW